MESSVEQSQKLHTAEHIFARCLQNQGLEIKVRKVDTKRTDGTGEAFITGAIPFDKILAAEQETVGVIDEGLEVSSEDFKDLNAAKGKFPGLRFNNEMLNGVSGIKVVKIGGFDFAACAQQHVGNTKEILAFAISAVSYPSGETKMMFRAGRDAMGYLLRLKGKVLEVASADNFDAERISDRYNALKDSMQKLNDDASGIIETVLDAARAPVIYVKVSNLNLLYKQMSDHVRKNPDKYVIAFNDTQLTGLKGPNCTLEIEKIGKELKDSGAFVGSIKADSISGKVLDLKKAQQLLEPHADGSYLSERRD